MLAIRIRSGFADATLMLNLIVKLARQRTFAAPPPLDHAEGLDARHLILPLLVRFTITFRGGRFRN